MKLGFELTLEQRQTLVMTPELIQAIQILQYNAQELDVYIEEQLLTNPVLEIDSAESEEKGDESAEVAATEQEEIRKKEKDVRDEDFDWSAYLEQREYDDISYRHMSPARVIYEDDGPDETERYSDNTVTLSETLMSQLSFAEMRESCRQAGRYIIECLDENGYLTQTEEELGAHLDMHPDRIHNIIRLIQTFEPAGVAARDLKECLALQLPGKDLDAPEIRQIIENHLEDLAANRLGLIARKIGVSVHRAQELADAIRTLEPKPGRQFGSGQANRYIIPDVIVEKVSGEYIVSVNNSRVPRLMVSPYYRRVLKTSDKDSSEGQFLTDRLNSALWLIKSIEQRSQTIYNVVGSIVKHQMEYFEKGQKHLKPLTLKKIADDIGIHESTVSRSINGKYIQTPRGVFEIKYFFTSGVSDGSAEGVASGSVKALIKEIVAEENASQPLSDQIISEMLQARGIDISRRTVAKYREEMGIPSSSRRKRY